MRSTSFAKLAAIAAASVLISACNGSDDEPASATDEPPVQVVKPPGGSTAPKNSAPVIGGSPPVAVTLSSLYDFRPTASDSDGDALTFSVENKPAWATFDPATGRLGGSPTAADLGIYANIQISVSDGKASSALAPFSINVARGFTDPGFDKDADFAARVSQSKAWYVNNFATYATLEDVLRDNESGTGGDLTMEGRRDLNREPAFALSGGKSLKLTMTPTSRQAGKFRVQFHRHAPAGPQKDGDSVREFYLQYAIYWTRPALTWTHRDAQKNESFKTLLLEGYGNGQVMPGMSRRIPVVRTSVNGANGCARSVKTPRGGEYSFTQSSLDDPAVILGADSRLEDYIAKHGLTSSIRDDSLWGYVSAKTEWSYRGRWETDGE